jgi:hypothetical protein
MELVVKVKGGSVAEGFIRKNPDRFSFRRTANGDLIVTLPVQSDGRCNIPNILSEQMVWMNLVESRTPDGLVTVVADSYGNPLKPFWVRSKKSQCQQDGIDVRFSVVEGAAVVTLNKMGLLVLSQVHLERRFDRDETVDYIKVVKKERLSVVLKRNGGKFLFPNPEILRKSSLKGYASVIEAAISKANKSSGPTYFLEKDLIVVFHETDGSTVVAEQRNGKTVLSGGVIMPGSSPKMTVRA